MPNPATSPWWDGCTTREEKTQKAKVVQQQLASKSNKQMETEINSQTKDRIQELWKFLGCYPNSKLNKKDLVQRTIKMVKKYQPRQTPLPTSHHSQKLDLHTLCLGLPTKNTKIQEDDTNDTEEKIEEGSSTSVQECAPPNTHLLMKHEEHTMEASDTRSDTSKSQHSEPWESVFAKESQDTSNEHQTNQEWDWVWTRDDTTSNQRSTSSPSQSLAAWEQPRTSNPPRTPTPPTPSSWGSHDRTPSPNTKQPTQAANKTPSPKAKKQTQEKRQTQTSPTHDEGKKTETNPKRKKLATTTTKTPPSSGDTIYIRHPTLTIGTETVTYVKPSRQSRPTEWIVFSKKKDSGSEGKIKLVSSGDFQGFASGKEVIDGDILSDVAVSKLRYFWQPISAVLNKRRSRTKRTSQPKTKTKRKHKGNHQPTKATKQKTNKDEKERKREEERKEKEYKKTIQQQKQQFEQQQKKQEQQHQQQMVAKNTEIAELQQRLMTPSPSTMTENDIITMLNCKWYTVDNLQIAKVLSKCDGQPVGSPTANIAALIAMKKEKETPKEIGNKAPEPPPMQSPQQPTQEIHYHFHLGGGLGLGSAHGVPAVPTQMAQHALQQGLMQLIKGNNLSLL